MSKLIVEMDMPRFCAECPMCDNVYYGDDVRKSFCIVFDERKEILTEDRPTWCPIKGEIIEIELKHLEQERAFAARNIATERKDDDD
jgi:hypothetical protein